MRPERLEREDLAVLRRVRGGGRPNATLLTRAVWIFARLWDDREAAVRLRALLAGSAPEAVAHAENLLALVRAADGADSSPSGTSHEFAWRHPEIVERVRDALARA